MKQTIPPQLTRRQWLNLNTFERRDAEAAGRLDVSNSGRPPLPFEQSGERFASKEEAALQRMAQRKAEAAAFRESEARRGITETRYHYTEGEESK